MLCAHGRHLIRGRVWHHARETYCSAHVPGEVVIADARDNARVQAMARELAEEEEARERLDALWPILAAKLARDMDADDLAGGIAVGLDNAMNVRGTPSTGVSNQLPCPVRQEPGPASAERDPAAPVEVIEEETTPYETLVVDGIAFPNRRAAR